MYKLNKKHLFILIVCIQICISCNTQKTFSGTEQLDCPSYESTIKNSQKKKSKWRLVLYKDGEKVGRKKKRGETGLDWFVEFP